MQGQCGSFGIGQCGEAFTHRNPIGFSSHGDDYLRNIIEIQARRAHRARPGGRRIDDRARAGFGEVGWGDVMKHVECNLAVYRVKMIFATLTCIAAWCGPIALFAYVLA